MKQAEQVKEWHHSFSLPVATAPTLPAPDRFAMRQKILQEEVNELEEAYADGDIVGIADAIVDSMYVLLGTAVECGLADKMEALFSEVHRSNMSKLDENGKPVLRADGKVLKSHLFTPPRLEPLIF